MTGKSSATVETLTAEVRVLMVGSRQVTLSVYGQLDEVGGNEIEPFGRVRPREAISDYLYLVGRHNETGALVRARVPGGRRSIAQEYEWHMYSEEIERLERKSRACQREVAQNRQFEDQVHSAGINHRCMADDIRRLESEVLSIADEIAGQRRDYDETTADAVAKGVGLAALPLIVLAGLR